MGIRRLAAMAALGALALAGCGGGDDEEAAVEPANDCDRVVMEAAEAGGGEENLREAFETCTTGEDFAKAVGIYPDALDENTNDFIFRMCEGEFSDTQLCQFAGDDVERTPGVTDEADPTATTSDPRDEDEPTELEEQDDGGGEQ